MSGRVAVAMSSALSLPSCCIERAAEKKREKSSSLSGPMRAEEEEEDQVASFLEEKSATVDLQKHFSSCFAPSLRTPFRDAHITQQQRLHKK